MNKIIVNGVDISKVVDAVEKVKDFIKQVEQAEAIHRQKAWEHSNLDDVESSQWHFGYAVSCRATINDLERILGIDDE